MLSFINFLIIFASQFFGVMKYVSSMLLCRMRIPNPDFENIKKPTFLHYTKNREYLILGLS